MSEHAGTQAGTEVVQSTTPGGLLRQARERQGRTLREVAEALHLDVWMLEAIEANRFAALGAPVYAKGHLRKYASLLAVAPAEVLELYEQLGNTPSVPMPVPVTVATPMRPDRPSMSVPAWTLGGVLAVGTMWGVYEALREPATHAVPPVPELTAEVQPEPEPELAPSAVAVPAQTLTAPAQPVTQSPVPAQQLQLRLQFSAASWAEIYDAAGKRLWSGTGEPGSARTVTGAAPLHVRLGFAEAVSMQINGASVAVPRRAGRDATRFIVEADGSAKRETAALSAADEVAVE